MPYEEYFADADARYNRGERMLGAAWKGPGYHSLVPDGTWVHSTVPSMEYALALLWSGRRENATRAADIVDRVLGLQDTDPTNATYGIWPWHLEEPVAEMRPPDWNWADFIGARIATALALWRDLLPEPLLGRMSAALGHAAMAIFRRNVTPGYTNIAVMGAGATLAAGELLDEPLLFAYGRRRLRRVIEHFDLHGGFNEYNSPTYTTVVLHECERILAIVRDESARADAEDVRARCWRTIAEHWHVATNQWAGPHSRAYADRIYDSYARVLAARIGADIPPHPHAPARGAEPPPIVPPIPCPWDLADLFRAHPGDREVRRRFIRREPDERSAVGTTWLGAHVSLGSISRDNFWDQRRPLIGYWRTADDPAVALRLRFLHDGHDFASACVRNAQRGPRALSGITLLSDKADHHDHLDRPADGRFAAEDFRARYELRGTGATVETLRPDRFALVAGDHRAVVHALPGRFGDNAVRWETGSAPAGEDEPEDRAWVDAFCWHGARRTFDFNPSGEFAAPGSVFLAAAVEILGPNEEPGVSPVAGDEADGAVPVAWDIRDGEPPLRVVVPTHVEPYGA